MLMGALISMGLVIGGVFSPVFTSYFQEQLSAIDFPEFILGTLLCFLLFAGSLHVLFSVLVQGMTMEKIVRRLKG